MAIELALIASKLQNLSTSDHASIVSMNLFVALLGACIVLGHLLEENRWMNESITALLIGICTGVFILLLSGGKSSHILVFSEDLFFIYLLPPIIFNAGFQVKKEAVFCQLHDYHVVWCYWHTNILLCHNFGCYASI